jgi:hypothetical protein
VSRGLYRGAQFHKIHLQITYTYIHLYTFCSNLTFTPTEHMMFTIVQHKKIRFKPKKNLRDCKHKIDCNWHEKKKGRRPAARMRTDHAQKFVEARRTSRRLTLPPYITSCNVQGLRASPSRLQDHAKGSTSYETHSSRHNTQELNLRKYERILTRLLALVVCSQSVECVSCATRDQRAFFVVRRSLWLVQISINQPTVRA